MSARDRYTFGDAEPDDSDDAMPSLEWLSEALASMFPPLEPEDFQLSLWEESEAYRDGPGPRP